MNRPFGWTDQFCIDELLKQVQLLTERVETLEETVMVLSKRSSGRRPSKPTAQGNLRVSGARK